MVTKREVPVRPIRQHDSNADGQADEDVGTNWMRADFAARRDPPSARLGWAAWCGRWRLCRRRDDRLTGLLRDLNRRRRRRKVARVLGLGLDGARRGHEIIRSGGCGLGVARRWLRRGVCLGCRCRCCCRWRLSGLRCRRSGVRGLRCRDRRGGGRAGNLARAWSLRRLCDHGWCGDRNWLCGRWCRGGFGRLCK